MLNVLLFVFSSVSILALAFSVCFLLMNLKIRFVSFASFDFKNENMCFVYVESTKSELKHNLNNSLIDKMIVSRQKHAEHDTEIFQLKVEDNLTTEWKRTREKKETIYKTQHGKLKPEQRKLHQSPEWCQVFLVKCDLFLLIARYWLFLLKRIWLHVPINRKTITQDFGGFVLVCCFVSCLCYFLVVCWCTVTWICSFF